VITSSAFRGRRYVVLGLARSGMASLEALLASGAEVTAWDRRDEPREALAARALPGLTLADPLVIDLSGFDGVVVSPGVPLNTHPIADKAGAAGVPVIGDIELFALARPDLPPHKVVGITGTNGKSTTTALVHHILKTAGVPTTMGGNIGLPILGQEPLTPNEHGVGVYVLELSSYQIDLTYSLDCDVAVLTNITPDHLDRYAGFEAYAASKARLFEMQATGWAVIATDDPTTKAIAAQRGVELTRVSMDEYPEWQRHWPALQGPHNRQNAAVAIAAVKELGIDWPTIEVALASFPGLPHRMERIGEFAGVLYVNDSKATNPASTAPALAAYPPNPDKRLHWIVGGLPKGDNLDECAPHFGNVVCAYTIGEAGPLFSELLKPHMRVERSEMMCEAVRQAIAAAHPGDVVLLSPACASFDQFRDYETRGEFFRRLVMGLAGGDEEAARQAEAECVGRRIA
jgi:UDP-N-acetylmuramoylalanine--D-glutamate ligase